MRFQTGWMLLLPFLCSMPAPAPREARGGSLLSSERPLVAPPVAPAETSAVAPAAIAPPAVVMPPPVAASDTPRLGLPLHIDADLLDFLAWAQSTARTETVLCLRGSYQSGRIVVDGFTVPHMTERAAGYARFDGCAGRGVVGMWHPHGGDFAGVCTFSDPDRASFRGSGLYLDLLTCGQGEFRFMVAGDTTVRAVTRAP